MPLSGPGNLTATLLNQLFGQDQNAPSGPTAVPAGHTNRTTAVPEDRFTRSSQDRSAQTTGQEAGLFQISQFSTFSIAADFAQAQRLVPQAAQNAAPGQAVQTLAAVAPPQTTAPQIAAPASTAATAAEVQN
jgi:hypothetical protein